MTGDPTDPDPDERENEGEGKREGDHDPFANLEAPDDADPFDSLDRDAVDRDGEDPFEAFDRPDVDGVDPDEVWDELTEHREAGERGDGEPTFYEVSKHKFCERCEYFSPPPEVECGHEGTEIVEFLDMERVRLVDCPVVAEYRRIGGVSEIE